MIEPSIGLDRLFMALLCDAYQYNKERDYIVLHLTPKLCPNEYAVFPLPSKEFPKQQFYAPQPTRLIIFPALQKHILIFLFPM